MRIIIYECPLNFLMQTRILRYFELWQLLIQQALNEWVRLSIISFFDIVDFLQCRPRQRFYCLGLWFQFEVECAQSFLFLCHAATGAKVMHKECL